MRVGILTGGGDCPGLNAVIRAIVRKGIRVHGDELVGFEDGYQGLVDQRAVPLDIKALRGKLPIGGTILGTSRYQPFMDADGVDRVRTAYAELGIDALIAVGGEGTLGAARDLSDLGFPIVGVPKTIDNDMAGTEMTFGFQTAVQICTDAIDRLHTTAESHDRVMVVEVMGRHAGHIAVWSGIAGGATVTLIPELFNVFGGRWRLAAEWVKLAALAFSCAFMVAVVWWGIPEVEDSIKYESRTESLAFPMWPFLAVLLASFACMAITMLFQLWFAVEKLRGRAVPEEAPDREPTH